MDTIYYQIGIDKVTPVTFFLLSKAASVLSVTQSFRQKDCPFAILQKESYKRIPRAHWALRQAMWQSPRLEFLFCISSRELRAACLVVLVNPLQYSSANTHLYITRAAPNAIICVAHQKTYHRESCGRNRQSQTQQMVF